MPRAVRVLIVDDQKDFRFVVRRLLEDGVCEVVGEAADGLEAIEQARELKPDVIVMDYKMPRLDGLEASRMIKAELPHIDIIMFTSSPHPGEAEMKARGATAYFEKSEIDELVTALEGWPIGP